MFRFLEINCRPDDSGVTDINSLISGSLTIVNIIQNCASLPPCLESSLPVYLRRYTREIDKSLREKDAPIAGKHASNVLDMFARIKDNKRTSHSYFVDELVRFTNVLNKYVS